MRVSDQIELDFGDLPSWAKRIAVFDLETTGLVLSEARIVTAAIAELDEVGQVVSSLEWLADPGIEIPEAASRVHGITSDVARANGRKAAEVVSEIVSALETLFLKGIPVVIYNAPYDLTILHFEALRYGINPLANPSPVLDPLVIDKFVDTYRPGKRTLEAAALVYGVELSNAHNSTQDAIAAGRIAQKLVSKHIEKIPVDVFELHEAQSRWSNQQDESYEEFRRKSTPDFTVKRGWPLKL